MFLYLAFSCIPFEAFIVNQNTVCLLIRIAIQFIFLIVSYFIIKYRTVLNIRFKKINTKYLFLLIPTVIATCSNYLYFAFVPGDYSFSYSDIFFLNVILTLFVVLNEEFIFRLVFINAFESGGNWKKILVSSAVFAICHLSTYFSTFDPVDLIIPVYTFALGILLGIIYTRAKSISMCIIFHFLFNVLNLYVFEMCIFDGISKFGIYIIANLIISVIVGLYLLILIFTKKLIINDEYI